MATLFNRTIVRRLREREDGVTLAELIVTMVLLGLLVSAVALMVTTSMRVASGTKERMQQTNSASLAMSRISRNLRTAVLQSQLAASCGLNLCPDSAFLKGTPTSVAFYADVDNPNNTIGPSRITYDVAGGVLTETVQKPDSPVPDQTGYHYCTTGSTCVIRTTILASGVQTTKPLFAYYTSLDPTNAMTMTANALTSDQLKKVDSIDVQLQVQQPGGTDVGPASMIQRVALPNADSIPPTNGTTP